MKRSRTTLNSRFPDPARHYFLGLLFLIIAAGTGGCQSFGGNKPKGDFVDITGTAKGTNNRDNAESLDKTESSLSSNEKEKAVSAHQKVTDLEKIITEIRKGGPDNS